MRDKLNVYDEVTQRIIAALEAGTAPWVKPWDPSKAERVSSDLPFNATSQRPYSGVNVILLWMFGPPGMPAYMTFKQAEKLGARVRPGSKGYRIVYADSHVKRRVDEQTGEELVSAYSFLKKHTVFHISQIDGLPAKYFAEPEGKVSKVDDAGFNAWVDNTRAQIRIGGAKACYMPAVDWIGMPPVNAFKSQDDYKGTLTHELGHWTGHKSRLARGFKMHGPDYAREELVAEICSAFCCARLGITGQLQHPEYIGHWIRVLKEDNKAIFRAASAAQKACDYLFKLQTEIPASRALTLYRPQLPAVRQLEIA